MNWIFSRSQSHLGPVCRSFPGSWTTPWMKWCCCSGPQECPLCTQTWAAPGLRWWCFQPGRWAGKCTLPWSVRTVTILWVKPEKWRVYKHRCEKFEWNKWIFCDSFNTLVSSAFQAQLEALGGVMLSVSTTYMKKQQQSQTTEESRNILGSGDVVASNHIYLSQNTCVCNQKNRKLQIDILCGNK